MRTTPRGMLVVTALSVAALSVAACGDSGSSDEPASRPSPAAPAADQDPAKAAEEAMRQAEKAMKEATGGKVVPAVDAKALADLLPEEWDGRKRQNVERQRVKQMGVEISEANCDYPADAEGASYTLKITDMGGLGGGAFAAGTAWAMAGEYERTTETGWEKTYSHKGAFAQETWDSDGKYGSFRIVVGKRFLVEADGNETTIEKVRGLVDAVSASKLEALAK